MSPCTFNFSAFPGERGLHPDDPALLDGDPDRAGHPRQAAALAAPEVQGKEGLP